MTDTWLDPNISLRLCLTLLHSLWVIPVLAAIASLGDRFWRRSVEKRYVVHVAALLLGLLALPTTYALVDAPAEEVAMARPVPSLSPHMTVESNVPLPADAGPARSVDTGDDVPSVTTIAPAAPAVTASPHLSSPQSAAVWTAAARWIAALYALGVLIMLVRLAYALSSAQRQIAGASTLTFGPVFDTLMELARGWSMRVVPAVAIAERIVVPQVIGLVRPMILLPASSLTGLSPDELRMILAHELAHIRRHDLWVNLLQRLAETVLFFNPALWYLTRRISTLREFCCDELTCRTLSSAVSAPRTRYAAALLRVAELSCPTHAAGSELAALAATGRSPSELRRRIAHLFGEPIREPLRLSRGSLLVIVAGIALLLAGPALWQSSADSADPQPTNGIADSDKDGNPAELRISGTCNTADGQPIRNAEVRLYRRILPSFEVALLQTVQTGDDGRYQFEAMPFPSAAKLQALVEDFSLTASAAGRCSKISFLPPRFATTVAMDFSLKPAAMLEGRITGRDLQPIVGADVWIQGIGLGPVDGILSAKTDADGHFAIRDAEPWKTGDDDTSDPTTGAGISIPARFYRIRHPEYGTQIGRFTKTPATVGETFSPAAIVEGRVVIADSGKPIAGVLVRACSQSDPGLAIGSEFVHTGADGRYRMALPESTYNLWTHHDDLTVLAIEGFAVKSGETRTAADLQLIKGGLVVGRLVDANSGELVTLQEDDIAHLTISGPARPISSGAVQVEPIQTDGSFRFRLPPGRNELALPHSSYGSFTFADKPDERITVNVVDGQTLDLPLKVNRVAKVDQRSVSNGPSTKSHPQPEEAVAQGAQAQSAGQSTTNETPRFELLVVDTQGQPVPNAGVELRISPHPTPEQILVGEFVKESTYGPFVKTDEDGRLVFSYVDEPRQFNLNITTPGYGPYWAQWSSDEHPEAIPSQFTAELEAGWSVGGIVVDEQGAPIAGVQVHPSLSFKKRPGDDEHLGVGTRITTDAAGAWWFDSVPASMSEVGVQIDHPDYAPNRRALTRRGFELERGQTPTARITMAQGLRVTGRVTDEEGKPIVGALLRTKFLNDIREAYTDSNGDYRIVGCEPRTARLVVSAAGRATDMQMIRPDPDLGPVNFTMRPGGHVRIRVVDEQGNGIPRSRIFYQRWRGIFDYFEFDHVDQYADENGVWEWNEAPLDEFQADICRPDGMQLSRQKLIARDEEYVFTPPPALVVSGAVVDAVTKEPIKKFRVTPGLRNADPAIRMNWNTSDSYEAADGTYRLRFSHSYPSELVRIEADGYEVAISRDIRPDEGEITVNFELQPAADIAATILTPDGQPAAGAKVALALAGMQVNIRNGEIDDGGTYATRRDATADGSFRFSARNERFHLVVTHPSGYAWFKSAEQEIPATIELTPWARIEGVFRAGARPAENVTLTYSNDLIHSYGDDVPSIFTRHKTTTGPGGRYVFERVVPGEGRIGREIVFMVKDGATEATSSKRVRVNVPAGQSTNLDLGGDGRAVIARLSPKADAKLPVLWNIAMVSLDAGGLLPPRPAPPDDVQQDEARRQQWWQDWNNSPAGKEWRKAYEARSEQRSAGPQIMATVDRNGAFRIDDVPPGDYVLDVRFNLGEPGLNRSAGGLMEYPITVPAADDLTTSPPVDLGVLQLE